MMPDFLKKLISHKDLLFALTAKEFRTRYKSAILGFLWAFLNPLLQMMILGAVFTFIVRIQVPNYPIFLFSGILPWSFFSQSLAAGTSSLVNNRDLIKKASFPRAILPFSAVLANLINFVLSLVIFIPVALFFSQSCWGLLVLPAAILLQVFLISGFVLLTSSLDIYYRDVSFILQALIVVWFYITPVIYPITMVPAGYAGLYSLNPMVGITMLYHFAFLGGDFPDFSMLAISLASALAVFALGAIVFKKRERFFADWV